MTGWFYERPPAIRFGVALADLRLKSFSILFHLFVLVHLVMVVLAASRPLCVNCARLVLNVWNTHHWK
jgi:hypothetical protein